jgi:3-oxoadipate CoA-transferase, alpha subunit
MPMNKVVSSVEEAVEGITDGSVLMVSGFGGAGSPAVLLEAVARQKLRDLTIIGNNAGAGKEGLAALLASGAVRKVVCSYPRMPGSVVFDELYYRGEIELELCPQGTLSERIRAGGAGIGGFYTPVGSDTELGRDREHRILNGRDHVLEFPLKADFAFIRAYKGDRWGNLVYNKAARNFGPTMAMAATTTVVEVAEVLPLGSLDPEAIVTPGVFVQRILKVAP